MIFCRWRIMSVHWTSEKSSQCVLYEYCDIIFRIRTQGGRRPKAGFSLRYRWLTAGLKIPAKNIVYSFFNRRWPFGGHRGRKNVAPGDHSRVLQSGAFLFWKQLYLASLCLQRIVEIDLKSHSRKYVFVGFGFSKKRPNIHIFNVSHIRGVWF